MDLQLSMSEIPKRKEPQHTSQWEIVTVTECDGNGEEVWKHHDGSDINWYVNTKEYYGIDMSIPKIRLSDIESWLEG